MPDTSAPQERARHATQRGFLKSALIALCVVVFALLVWAWRHVLLLLFAAILIASGFQGFAEQIRKVTPLGPKAAVAIAGIIVLALLTGAGFFFGHQIAAQATTLSETLPQAWTSVQSQLMQTELGRQALEQARSAASGDNLLGDLARRAGQLGFSFASGALDAFLVLVASVFLALSPQSYRDGILALAPSGCRAEARKAFDTSGAALKKWLLGTLVSMVAMSLMIGLGLWSLGVPAALALALIAGLAQFVPFIGPILAAVPAILLALASSPTAALWVALLYFAASTIEANVLYPMIQKRAVHQLPVLTLFTVIAFGLLLGPLGAVVAVPLTVVITVFVVVFYVRGVLHEEMPAPGEN